MKTFELLLDDDETLRVTVPEEVRATLLNPRDSYSSVAMVEFLKPTAKYEDEVVAGFVGVKSIVQLEDKVEVTTRRTVFSPDFSSSEPPEITWIPYCPG